MKTFTDIEQSKKLAEFLPLESADMYYFTIIRDYPYSQGKIKTIAKIMDGSFSSDYDTPCWSLAALLKCLGKIKPQVYTPILFLSKGKWILQFAEYGHGNVCEVSCNNPVDACYEMIIKFKENNLL